MSLRPKKLSYTENQQDEGNNQRMTNGNSPSQIFSLNFDSSTNRKEIEKRSPRRTDSIRKNISLQVNDKENRKYGRRKPAEKVKENAKRNGNSSSSFELNSNSAKGEFVHFRI